MTIWGPDGKGMGGRTNAELPAFSPPAGPPTRDEVARVRTLLLLMDETVDKVADEYSTLAIRVLVALRALRAALAEPAG